MLLGLRASKVTYYLGQANKQRKITKLIFYSVQLLPEILDLVDIFILEIEELFVPKVNYAELGRSKYE
jgi:hypothetical protein